MKFRTSHGLAIGITLLFLSQVQHLESKYRESQARKALTDQARSQIADDRADAKNTVSRSVVALERVKAGCLPVTTGGFEEPLREGSPVVTGGTRDALPDGAFVCTSTGHTGAVITTTKGSTITGVAVASLADLPAYQDLFKQLPNASAKTKPTIAEAKP